MAPQGLMEHSVQVHQTWQVILRDRLVATDLLDFLQKAILVQKTAEVINGLTIALSVK